MLRVRSAEVALLSQVRHDEEHFRSMRSSAGQPEAAPLVNEPVRTYWVGATVCLVRTTKFETAKKKETKCKNQPALVALASIGLLRMLQALAYLVLCS